MRVYKDYTELSTELTPPSSSTPLERIADTCEQLLWLAEALPSDDILLEDLEERLARFLEVLQDKVRGRDA